MNFKYKETQINISFWFAATIAFLLITDKNGNATLAIIAAGLHELGHIFTFQSQAYGIGAIYLAPYGIKIIPLPNCQLSYKKEIQVALNGPLVNLLLFLLCTILCETTFIVQNITLINIFAKINAALFIFNMLPIGCLDGGRILYACTALIRNELIANKLLKTIGYLFAILCTTLYIFGTINGTTNLNHLICLIFILSLAFLYSK